MGQYLQNSNSLSNENEIINKKLFTSPESIITNKTDQVVLGALKENQPATRKDLCEKTGIPRTTIYDALTRLILKKVVIKYSTPRTSKGRPKVFYRIAQTFH